MMITTLPGVNTMKPGSAGPPLPGIDARVVDAQGEVDAGQAGYVTVSNPGPACFARCTTTTSGSSRVLAGVLRRGGRRWVYFPEDGAKIDDDDYITILGRVDDVINVSGHRLGTMEIESSVVGVEGIAEAAVVGGDHEVKGEAVYVYAIPEDGYEDRHAELEEKAMSAVLDSIGPIAKPEEIVFTHELPKTRSGQDHAPPARGHRVGNELGNTSTLRNPDVVDDIAEQVETD